MERQTNANAEIAYDLGVRCSEQIIGLLKQYSLDLNKHCQMEYESSIKAAAIPVMMVITVMADASATEDFGNNHIKEGIEAILKDIKAAK